MNKGDSSSPIRPTAKRAAAAFTLAEVAMCLAMTGAIFAGITVGYLETAHEPRHSERLPAIIEATVLPSIALAEQNLSVSIPE